MRTAVIGAILAGLLVGGASGLWRRDLGLGLAVGVGMTVIVGLINLRELRASRAKQ
jgi:hypothetical protein